MKHKCKWCSFETDDKELFEKHSSIYHQNRTPEEPYNRLTNEQFIEYERGLNKLVLCPYCNKPFDWNEVEKYSKCSWCGNVIQFHGRIWGG